MAHEQDLNCVAPIAIGAGVRITVGIARQKIFILQP
jgi:hypothetical protein